MPRKISMVVPAPAAVRLPASGSGKFFGQKYPSAVPTVLWAIETWLETAAS
jgi:hypothetical protein